MAVASVGIMGPYAHDEVLEPGQSKWVNFGQSDGYFSCALSVTATPHDGVGADVLTMKVDNVNVTILPQKHVGDPEQFTAGCNVTNNGKGTITRWSVLVGVIRP